MAVKIQIRNGTAAEWTSANPTLAAGELGVETDTYKAKIGDGSTAWTSLQYIEADAGAHAANHLEGGSDPVTITYDQVSVPSISATPGADTWGYTYPLIASAGTYNGNFIVDAGGGEININAGGGTIRQSASPLADIELFSWDAVSGVAIASGVTAYVGVKYNGGSPIAEVRYVDDWNGFNEFTLGRLVHEGGGDMHIVNSPQLVEDEPRRVYDRFLRTHPIEYSEVDGGLALAETGTRNLTVSAGALYEGLSKFTISAIDTSGSDTFESYYRDGGAGFTITTGNTQWDNDKYDDGTGTLASLTAGYYGVHWFYIDVNGELAHVYGRGDYATVVAAEGDALASVPLRVSKTATLLARAIFQKGASSFTSISSAFDTEFTGTPTYNHNNDLAGLQGGSASERYHGTAAQEALWDDAIHDSVSSEIRNISLKSVPTTSDVMLIEDAAASYAKKSITIGLLPLTTDSVFVSGVDVGISGATFTTSATFVDMNGMSITPAAGTYLATFHGVVGCMDDDDEAFYLAICKGSTPVTRGVVKLKTRDKQDRVFTTHVARVTVNGSETVKIRYRSLNAGKETYALYRKIELLKINA